MSVGSWEIKRIRQFSLRSKAICSSTYVNSYVYVLTSNVDIAGRLVLALLAKLDDLAGVLAGVLLLRALDLELLDAVVAGDEEVGVRRLDLLAVLEPLDLGVRVVRLAFQLQFPLCLAVLLLVQLLLEAPLRVRS